MSVIVSGDGTTDIASSVGGTVGPSEENLGLGSRIIGIMMDNQVFLNTFVAGWFRYHLTGSSCQLIRVMKVV
jgi:hypothetical protein